MSTEIQPSGVVQTTYSGVIVYEMLYRDLPLMLRMTDYYLNATQILKIAEFSKPLRTRILLNEVQKGEHKIVQGGYGKYQGTWVPFETGVALAEEHNLKDIFMPLFEYRTKTSVPPIKIKNRKNPIRKPKSRLFSRRIQPSKPAIKTKSHPQPERPPFVLLPCKKPIKNLSIWYSQLMTDEDILTFQKRPTEPKLRRPHAEKLLEYFNGHPSGLPRLLLHPPPDFNINVSIDHEGNTALHYAASIGRLCVLQIMIDYGVDINRRNLQGQTALSRSVLFTHNYSRNTFKELLRLLSDNVTRVDKECKTIFHHAAALVASSPEAGLYYAGCTIHTLESHPIRLTSLLNKQDSHGNTPLSIALELSSKKMVRLLIAAGARTDYIKATFPCLELRLLKYT